MADLVPDSDLPDSIVPASDLPDSVVPAPDETVGRVAGLAGRALAKGVGDIGQLAATMGSHMQDPTGIQAAQESEASAASHPADQPYTPKLSDFIHPDRWQQAIDYLGDKAGIAAPATPGERIASKAVEALPSAILAPEAPVAGAVSAALGGGASQATAEAGGGPVAQTVAGLAAGGLPALGAAAGATVRGAVRGASGAPMASALADAAASDTQLSVGQASGNRAVQTAEAASGKLWGGGAIQDLGARQNGAAGLKVSRIVDNLNQGGAPLTPQATGETIGAGATAAKGSMRQAEQQAYAAADKTVPPQTPIPITGDLATSKLTSQKQAIEDSVAKTIGPVSETPTSAGQTIDQGVDVTKQAMKASEKAAYDKVDQLVPPETPIPVKGTLAKLGELSTPTEGAEATTSALVPKAITQLKSNIEADIAAGQKGTATPPSTIVGADGKPLVAGKPAPPVDLSAGTLPYSAVASTRSKLGNTIDWGYSPADPVTNRGLQQVYHALTEDLNNGASAVSPEARSAVGQARSMYATNSDRREALNAIVNKAGGPEAIYTAATSGLKNGATKLTSVLGALDAEGQSTVRSTVLRRLGAADGKFDTPTFFKNWTNLSPEAKTTLAGPGSKVLDQAAEAHANLTRQVKTGAPVSVPYGELAAERDRLKGVLDDQAAGVSKPDKSVQKAHDDLVGQMQAGASQAVPAARTAFGAARALEAQNAARRATLDSVVEKAGGLEAVYNAATSGAKAGATKIGAVMSALDPDSQNIVRATVIHRLGMMPAGSQNAGSFNADRLLTGYGNLSPEAKNALFGASGAPASLRASLDSLTATTARIRNSKQLVNPSGTGSAVGHTLGLAGLFTAVTEHGSAILHHPGVAIGTAATAAAPIVINAILARALTNPRVAAWLARSTKLPLSALPNAVNQLAQVGHQTKDQDAQLLAGYLQHHPIQ